MKVLPSPLWAPFELVRPGGGRIEDLGRRVHQLARIGRRIPAWLRLVRDEAPDVVVTNTATAVLPALAALGTRTPHVWWLHELVASEHGLDYVLGKPTSQRITGALAQRIVTSSETVARHFSPPIDRARIRVAYGAVRLSSTCPNEIVPGRSGSSSSAGSFQGRASTWLCGPWPWFKGNRSSPVFGSSDRGSLSTSSTYAGWPRSSMSARTSSSARRPRSLSGEASAANVVISCSTNEASGRSIAEALVSGRPVIGARSGGTPELVQDGFDGLLFSPGDAGSLAAAVRALGADHSLLTRMSSNASHRNSVRFSEQEQVRTWLDVFDAVTARSSGSGSGRVPSVRGQA